MGRPKRVDLGGYVYHVLNRSNGRAPIFLKNGDYEAFLRIAAQALDHVPGMRLLSYCLMPNHWHLVLWPRADGELSDFVHWLTLTHTQRWHAHYRDVGTGHLYQGRYKKAPTMFKSAPAGARHKRGRTYPINDPDVLRPNFDAFYKRPENLPTLIPVCLV